MACADARACLAILVVAQRAARQTRGFRNTLARPRCSTCPGLGGTWGGSSGARAATEGAATALEQLAVACGERNVRDLVSVQVFVSASLPACTPPTTAEPRQPAPSRLVFVGGRDRSHLSCPRETPSTQRPARTGPGARQTERHTCRGPGSPYADTRRCRRSAVGDRGPLRAAPFLVTTDQALSMSTTRMPGSIAITSALPPNSALGWPPQAPAPSKSLRSPTVARSAAVEGDGAQGSTVGRLHRAQRPDPAGVAFEQVLLGAGGKIPQLHGAVVVGGDLLCLSVTRPEIVAAMTFAAVLFDVDGVLLDSASAHQRIWNAWADLRGLDAGTVWQQTFGQRPEDTVRDVAPHVNLTRP